MGSLEVIELKRNGKEEWDEFVKRSNDSTFYHQIGWKKVVEKTYGHKSIYLMVKEDDEIRGILPLFLMKSKLLGNKLISVPFGSYGGVCADNEIIAKNLIEEAKSLTIKHNADFLELRHLSKHNLDLIEKSLHVTSILELEPDPDILYNKMKKDMRRNIKKAEKANLKIVWGLDMVSNFYKIYAQMMWTLGTPVHSIKLFNNIIREFPDNCNIITLLYKSKPITSMFLFFFKDTSIFVWIGSLREYMNLYPNHLVYWEGIKYSCARGYKYCNFGRSIKGSGILKFKERLGAETKQLYYQYYLNKIDDVPETSPDSTKYQMFAKVWKKLPIPIANLLGPGLRRNIP